VNPNTQNDYVMKPLKGHKRQGSNASDNPRHLPDIIEFDTAKVSKVPSSNFNTIDHDRKGKKKLKKYKKRKLKKVNHSKNNFVKDTVEPLNVITHNTSLAKPSKHNDTELSDIFSPVSVTQI